MCQNYPVHFQPIFSRKQNISTVTCADDITNNAVEDKETFLLCFTQLGRQNTFEGWKWSELSRLHELFVIYCRSATLETWKLQVAIPRTVCKTWPDPKAAT